MLFPFTVISLWVSYDIVLPLMPYTLVIITQYLAIHLVKSSPILLYLSSEPF